MNKVFNSATLSTPLGRPITSVRPHPGQPRLGGGMVAEAPRAQAVVASLEGHNGHLLGEPPHCKNDGVMKTPKSGVKWLCM